jgi:Coenzyme PQQ synthesis protein D (PqqD)
VNPSSPIVPTKGVVSKPVGDAIVLVHVASNRIFELNQSGARIWALVERGASRDEICRRLSEEFDVGNAEGNIDASVDDLLAQLASQGLIGG